MPVGLFWGGRYHDTLRRQELLAASVDVVAKIGRVALIGQGYV